MFNPFQQMAEIKKMRDQAMAIQRELQKEEVAIDKHGVRVVVTGDQRVKELNSNGKSDKDIVDAVNEAMKKSQEVAAKKLQQMGGLGALGGLLGGGQ